MADSLVVLGAGGHGAVVVATALAAGHEVVAAYDDDPHTHGAAVLGVPVVGTIADALDAEVGAAVIGIGQNIDRKAVATRFPFLYTTAVHPLAGVGPEVDVGEGSVVFAGAIIQARSSIGAHAIVNTGTIVDHDCDVGSFALVGPGAILAGGVAIGEGALIGVGATIAPGITLGPWVVVGAGAAVVANVPARSTVVGVPAKPIAQ